MEKLDRHEIDEYEFVTEVLNFRRHVPPFKFTKSDIERNFDYIPLFRMMLEMADIALEYERRWQLPLPDKEQNNRSY